MGRCCIFHNCSKPGTLGILGISVISAVLHFLRCLCWLSQVLGPLPGPAWANIQIGAGGGSSDDGGQTRVRTVFFTMLVRSDRIIWLLVLVRMETSPEAIRNELLIQFTYLAIFYVSHLIGHLVNLHVHHDVGHLVNLHVSHRSLRVLYAQWGVGTPTELVTIRPWDSQ